MPLVIKGFFKADFYEQRKNVLTLKMGNLNVSTSCINVSQF